MRIVFLGTRDIAVPVLECLLDPQRADWHVVGVGTQPDRPVGRSSQPVAPPVKRMAQVAGLPVLQPESWRDEEAVEAVRALQPDVGIVASYAQLLPRRLLRIPPAGWLNVHPSLLPRHRGPSPVAAAILAGDALTGVTIIKLVATMDAGPILHQVTLPVARDDTTASLTVRLGALGAQAMAQVLDDWVAGCCTPRPQHEEAATYSRLLTRADGQLVWSLPAIDLERRVRAFDPWPGTFTFWHGRRLAIRIARARAGVAPASPGTVLGLDRQEPPAALLVAASSGTLAVRRLQLEGRTEVGADEFVRGHPTILDARLGEKPGPQT